MKCKHCDGEMELFMDSTDIGEIFTWICPKCGYHEYDSQ